MNGTTKSWNDVKWESAWWKQNVKEVTFIALREFPLCNTRRKDVFFKGTFSGLREFLSTESPLKMMKNAFYFTLKALFVLKIFNFLSLLFSHVEKQLDWKDKLISKIWRDNLVNKQLQCTYCTISQEAEAIRQSNLGS